MLYFKGLQEEVQNHVSYSTRSHEMSSDLGDDKKIIIF